jgi:hypothetical protein
LEYFNQARTYNLAYKVRDSLILGQGQSDDFITYQSQVFIWFPRQALLSPNIIPIVNVDGRFAL